MITLEQAEEIVEFLEESLSNTYFHENAEANENGYRCAIADIKEHYIDSILNELSSNKDYNDSGAFISKVIEEYEFAKSKDFDSIVIIVETSGGEYEISEYEDGFINDSLDGVYSELDEIAGDLFSLISMNNNKVEGFRIE